MATRKIFAILGFAAAIAMMAPAAHAQRRPAGSGAPVGRTAPAPSRPAGPGAGGPGPGAPVGPAHPIYGGGYGGYYGRGYYPYYPYYGYGYGYPWYGGIGFSLGFGFGYGYGYPYYPYYPYYGYGYPYAYPAYPYGYPPAGYPGAGYPPAPVYGGIRLDLPQKDAQVYADGYYAGRVDDFNSSTERLALTGGTHHIEIQAEGFAPIGFDVNIEPGRTIIYRADLRQPPPEQPTPQQPPR